jgi:hypothetical protein
MPLFDKEAGSARREAGIAYAMSKNDRYTTVQLARAAARELALGRPEGITTDDLVAYYAETGIDLAAQLGNAMGGIFHNRKEWVWTGRVVPSRRPSRHRNLVRVWRLR